MIDKNGWEPEQLDGMRLALLPECYKKMDKIELQQMESGYPFEFNGKQYVFDITMESLFKLSQAYDRALEAKANNTDFIQKMIMRDYKVITLNRDEIIAKLQPMIATMFEAYNQKASNIETLQAMTYYELRTWMDS